MKTPVGQKDSYLGVKLASYFEKIDLFFVKYLKMLYDWEDIAKKFLLTFIKVYNFYNFTFIRNSIFRIGRRCCSGAIVL